MSEELLLKLGIQTGGDDLVSMPAGSMSFDASSYIAPWRAGLMYWFMSKDDWTEYTDEVDDDGAPLVTRPFLSTKRGDWYHLYYESFETARDIMWVMNPEAREKEYKPALHWVLYTATSDIMNIKDIDAFVEAVGPTLITDTHVQDLRVGSKRYPLKDRHQFALIALPSAVASVATFLGYRNPGVNLTELTQAREDDEWTEELYHLYVGDPVGEYADSLFAKYRKDLWAALGEPDFKKSAVKGSLSASGKPNNRATSSDKLSTCLGFVQGKWTVPIYCRVTNVKDPAPAAVSKNGRRLTIPCVTEIFADEAAARKAAMSEMVESGDGEPPIPESWGTYREAWIKAVQEFTVPDGISPIKEAACQEALKVSLADVTAWKDYLE